MRSDIKVNLCVDQDLLWLFRASWAGWLNRFNACLFYKIMTTGTSSDTTQPDYLWVSVVCEMKGIFNLQGWIFMEPDQIEILLLCL